MKKDELSMAEVNARLSEAALDGAHEQYLKEYGTCDHGVTFDEEAATILEGDWEPKTQAEFIMGNPASFNIRKRWPRLCGPCPKGCGYNGIYYASYKHYLMGDW